MCAADCHRMYASISRIGSAYELMVGFRRLPALLPLLVGDIQSGTPSCGNDPALMEDSMALRTCGVAPEFEADTTEGGGRRDFIKRAGQMGIGVALGPILTHWLHSDSEAAETAAQNPAVRTGKAQHITILHTGDIHAQLEIHDEFFWENGKPVFKRRGGLATLRTMINTLRRQNPGNTLVVDGGDCFHGSAVASFSRGQAIVPLLNKISYDLVLPGNWEVVYGKEMMIADLNMCSAAKVCANMFHAGSTGTAPIFPPYKVFSVAGIKVGFIGYNDPFTPTRQPPAYSRGIRFTHPEEDLGRYVTRLRETEKCE